jgi:hypothetical protein
MGRRGAPMSKVCDCFEPTVLTVLAAREVSQWGGGARRGSEAPELMSPVRGEIQAERA